MKMREGKVSLSVFGFVHHECPLLHVSIHRNIFLSLSPPLTLHHWPPCGGGCWAEELWLAAGHTGEHAASQWQFPVARASQWGHVEWRRIKGELNLSSHHHTATTDCLDKRPALVNLAGLVITIITSHSCFTMSSVCLFILMKREPCFNPNIWE